MKVDLTLSIKKKWLEKIVSGEKTEEYRDNKEYYHKKFTILDDDACMIDHPKTIKLFVPYQKHTFYCIISVKKIRYEQFFGETKPIPEGFVSGDIAYTIFIDKVLEHNL